jgi:hypothetical protein
MAGAFCRVTRHGQLLLAVDDVAFVGGAERLSVVVGDMLDVARPHPSMRGGAVVAVWWTWGPSTGGDVATVRDSDVAWLVGVGVGGEHALA